MNTNLNKSDYLLLLIYYVFAVVLNIIEYYNKDYDFMEFIVDIPVSIVVSLGTIIIFMNWLIPKFIIQGKQYLKFVIFGFLILSVFGMIDDASGFWSAGSDWNDYPKWYNAIINGIYTSSNNTGFIFGILLAKKFYEGRTELAAFEKRQKENELKLLRSQIDPHFLFNNLNTLDALIDKDTLKAKEYLNRLSLIYRYLIKTKDAKVMKLKEEISLAESYIYLIETRFGNDYDFQIEKHSTTFRDKFIPTGALQALLENVVKHNKSQDNKTIKTIIEIRDEHLIVTNTKSDAIPVNESLGTGLKNLQDRYELLSDVKMKVVNNDLQFKISLPIIKLSDE
ncbi:MAG: histidine kinase [Flavobacteriaceae bacterium]|nr:histidine kinase [Flavobacteriaceae bacterium]MBN4082962.1 histidine kinase [bacterium AH-315-A23]